MWVSTASHLTEATEQLKQERDDATSSGAPTVNRTQLNKKARVRARHIASTLLSAIHNNVPIWDAFNTAGERFQVQKMNWEQMEVSFAKYENDPTPENCAAYEQLEEQYESSRDYKILAEMETNNPGI